MIKQTLVAASLALAAIIPASADTYTYMCKVGRKLYPVVANEDKATLTWRGETYGTLTANPEECRYTFTATRNGVTATLCTATQGYADLKIGKDDFDCHMPDNPSPRVYRQWLKDANK